jgi:hypothetical protein
MGEMSDSRAISSPHAAAQLGAAVNKQRRQRGMGQGGVPIGGRVRLQVRLAELDMAHLDGLPGPDLPPSRGMTWARALNANP